MLETENLGLGFRYHLLADLLPSSSYTFNSLGVLHWRWEGGKGKLENHMEPFMLGKSCQIILWVRCLEISCWTPTPGIGQHLLQASCLLSILWAGEGCVPGGPWLGVPHFTQGGLIWMLWTRGRKALLVPQLTVPTTNIHGEFCSLCPPRKERRGWILLVHEAFYYYYHGGDVAISPARKHISLFEK